MKSKCFYFLLATIRVYDKIDNTLFIVSQGQVFLVFLFDMKLSNGTTIICWKDFVPVELPWSLCQSLMTLYGVDLFLDFLLLHYLFVCIYTKTTLSYLLFLSNNFWNQELYFLESKVQHSRSHRKTRRREAGLKPRWYNFSAYILTVCFYQKKLLFLWLRW